MKYLHVLNIFENHCDNAHIIKSFFWLYFFETLSIHRNIKKHPPPQIKNTNKTKPKIKKKQILNRQLHFAWVTLNVY